jgi:trimeric autotransporter adhesin
MSVKTTFLFSLKNKVLLFALVLFTGVITAKRTYAQVNIAPLAVAFHSSGGLITFGYGPDNYNDNVIPVFGGCSGYGTCPTPWGWVSDGGYITFTWGTAQTFNKVVFWHADRPMTSCQLQYWDGTTFVTIAPYTTAFCNKDSMSFTPVTTTILRMFNCTAPLINPNFREIQIFQSTIAPPTITGATHYCTGDTIHLTASSPAPSPTYNWSGPSAFSATTASIAVVASPATAGIYSCTVTSGANTSVAALDTIVVTPPPTITLSAIPAVCQGSTFATLAYTATTGTPTTYSIVYSTAAHTAGFIDITSVGLPASPIMLTIPGGAPTGTYTGILTVNNGYCSGPGVPISITLNPLPAPIAGATNICTGSISTLTDATSGGTWSSSNPAVATIGSLSGIVTGVTVGSTTIAYTLPTGCARTINVSVVGISGADHVCAGSTITLSATSTGGTWSSSSTATATVDGTTGVVTGVAMGVVHISYTLGTGCTATWAMTVNPLAPILGRDSVCVGSFTYLTDIVGGGTWTSVFPSVATITSDSGKITGILAGITTISYLLPTGCLSTTSFTVIDYPGNITGVKQACPGTSTTLSNGTPGGSWSSSNTSVATVTSSGTVIGVFADTVYIIYSVLPGCPVYTTVTINPLPQLIKGRDVICPASKDTLTDATPYGLWASGNAPIATVDAYGVVTAVSQGVGVISYTLPATGCFRTKNVTVNPLPVPVVTYNWSTNTFYATTGYSSYQWYDSVQGMIHGATSPNVAATELGYYYVVVTDSNGCTGSSAWYHYNTNLVGVKGLVNGNNVRIYPNPANAVLYIESPVKARVVITGIEGKVEMEQADAKEMNIGGLADGMYFVSIYDENGVRIAVQKLIKQ